MTALLFRSSVRYLMRHPWQIGLSILGVALGVAVVIAIDIAGSSARRAFELSAESIAGRATHQIYGSAGPFDEAVYRDLRLAGFQNIAPIVDADVGALRYPGRTFRLLGVDPFAEPPFRNFLGSLGDSNSIPIGALLVRPHAGAITALVAQRLGLNIGDTLFITITGRTDYIILEGLITPHDTHMATALESILVTDIATAQELLGRIGQISRIDVIAQENKTGQEEFSRLKKMLPPGVELVRSKARSESLEGMIKAFNLNLTALSFLALVVGVFLIYNTMTFSVVQRRPLIGRLRAIGVTRKEIFVLVISEAILIGSIGTLSGVALGIILGRSLISLITQTINDLYFVVSVREMTIEPLALLKGILLGLLATLAAALSPAHEATKASPRSVFSRSTVEITLRKRAPMLAFLGCVLFSVGVGILFLPTKSIIISYAALLCIILGFALLTPLSTIIGIHLLRVPVAFLFGITGRMAARSVIAALSRTSVAIAALMIAISATIGVGVMVDSFRGTVARWLEMSLEADIYVSPPSLVTRRNTSTLDPALVERLKHTPGIAETSTVKVVLTVHQGHAIELLAFQIGPRSEKRYAFKEETPGLWTAFRDSDAAIVSEPFSYHFNVHAGEILHLRTDKGMRDFRIVAVSYDYASDIGSVFVSPHTYSKYWMDQRVSGLDIFVQEGMPVDTLISRLRKAAGTEQPLLIRSNKVLRETSLAIFDRTFAITNVLRLLTIVVAFIGVLSALMALQLERAREIGVLRATGLTPRQVWKLVTIQTGLMGFVAGVLAVPLGLVLALVLIYVVNKRSFGWTLQFAVSPEILLQALVLALIAALLAGLYPAYRMSRTAPALALREE